MKQRLKNKSSKQRPVWSLNETDEMRKDFLVLRMRALQSPFLTGVDSQQLQSKVIRYNIDINYEIVCCVAVKLGSFAGKSYIPVWVTASAITSRASKKVVAINLLPQKMKDYLVSARKLVLGDCGDLYSSEYKSDAFQYQLICPLTDEEIKGLPKGVAELIRQ